MKAAPGTGDRPVNGNAAPRRRIALELWLGALLFGALALWRFARDDGA